MRLLTTAEASDYLRLSERKLYELVAQGAVPCTKVTGRWLFPREDLDAWLRAGLVRPEGVAPVSAPPIVGGSQDSLLECALRDSGSGLATLPEGTEAGFERWRRGELLAAAIHFHLEEGEDEASNVAMASRAAGGHDALVIAFARREQGILVAPGNPLGLTSLADAAERGAVFAMRQKGAGAQMLLETLLARAGVRVADVRRLPQPCLTGPDLANAVRAGRADCGLATRAAANAAGLGFVSILWEHFDLVLRQSDYFRPPMQALTRWMRDPAFVARAQELTGYDVSQAGSVRWSA